MNQFPTHNVSKSKPVGESLSLFPLLYFKKRGNRIIAMSSLHRIMILEGRGAEIMGHFRF